ncbi:hypothetical protein B0I37DRAFT_187200 [Chaetomium sp. MPI-CAGE-AT-0009]|nr:hypothetical protein B0I37DRAFT_187200 [Chaetomium sp. MPI-CAGE-AT-0009]
MALKNPTPVPDNGNLHRSRVPCLSSHSSATHTMAPAPSINMPKPRHLRRRSPIALPLDNLFPFGGALWYSGLTHRLMCWPPSEAEARLRIVRPQDELTLTPQRRGPKPTPAKLPPCGSVVLLITSSYHQRGRHTSSGTDPLRGPGASAVE